MYKLILLGSDSQTSFVADVHTKAAAVVIRDRYRKARIDADVVVDLTQDEDEDPDGLQPGDIVP